MHKQKGTQNLGCAGVLPSCDKIMADPWKYAAPHICHPAEFGRSRSNGVSIMKEIHLKNLSPTSCLSRSLEVIGTNTD